MKKFVVPSIDVDKLEVEDVITTSCPDDEVNCPDDGGIF